MNYEHGTIVTNPYKIKDIVTKKTHLELKLKHNDDDEVLAILKDNIDIFLRTFNVNDDVVCQSKVRKRGDGFFLEIIYIKKYDLQTKEPVKNDVKSVELIKKFDSLINAVKDVDYKALLLDLFSDDENDIRKAFLISPAARKNHHNYEFGLLQHSVETADISLSISANFKDINIDLLITAALLHDIGKIKTYEFDKGMIIKTDWDRFLGHLSISSIFVSKLLSKDFNSKKAMLLYHLILSHHGKLSSGSPVIAKTREAFILHYADVLSSMINHIDNLHYSSSGWSDKDELTNNEWYKGEL